VGQWLQHWLGADNASGPIYLSWSGWVSDLSELALVGLLVQLWRRHNCHVQKCWRLGIRPVSGTAHVVCKRHHPTSAPTHQQVIADHARAQQANQAASE
jgi:hypothetical protein